MVRDLWRRLTQSAAAPLAAETEQLALAVLMVRLARADGHYTPDESARIERVLCTRYGLSPEGARRCRLEAETEEAEAPDTVRYTRALKEAVPVEERAGLLEALWSVALSDGGRDAQEDSLMRLVVPLLGLTDVDSGLARQRVLRRLE